MDFRYQRFSASVAASDEQRPARRPIFPAACRHSALLPDRRRDCGALRAAAGRGGDDRGRAARAFALRTARAGVAAVAFPVGQGAARARHAELSFPRVAARACALHVHRRDGIPHGHHRQTAEKFHRGFPRWNGRALRARCRARLGVLPPHGAFPKEDLAHRGDALPRSLDVHHGIPDAGEDNPFQKARRHDDGHGGDWRRRD